MRQDLATTIPVTPRFVPMMGDHMTSTVQPGEMLVVVPAAHYSGEGLYLLEMVPGAAEVRRLEADLRGWISCTCDNAGHKPLTGSGEQIQAMIIGRVSAVGRVLAPDLLPRRAGT